METLVGTTGRLTSHIYHVINHVIKEANSLTHDIAQWTIVSLLWGLISISLVPFSLFKSQIVMEMPTLTQVFVFAFC